MGAALLLPAMLVLGVIGGLVVGLWGRLVRGLDDDALARLVSRAYLPFGALAAVILLPFLGSGLVWLGVGACVGAVLAILSRPSAQPSAARVRAARDLYRAAARLIQSRSVEDDTDALTAQLKSYLVDCEMEVGSRNTTTARMLSLVADFLQAEEKWNGARALYERALKIFKSCQDCAAETALIYHNLGVLFLRIGEPDRGIASCEKALSYSNQPLDMARMEEVQARLWASRGEFDKAVESAAKSLDTTREKMGESHHKTLELTAMLAEFSGRGGDGATARGLLTEVLRLREQAGLPEDATSLEMRARLAAMEGAAEKFVALLEPLRLYGGPKHPWARTVIQWSLPHILLGGWDQPTASFWTALAEGDLTLAKTLLGSAPEAGIEIDRSAWSVLHWVAFWGHDQMFDSLVFHGNVPVDLGPIPATLVAARWGRRKMLMALLKRGVNPAAVDEQGRGVVHMAALAGDAKTLAALKDEGLDLEARDKSGNSPLHLACLYGRSEAVLELICAGVQLSRLTEDGRSPLHLAVESGSPLTAQALLNNGARLKDKDSLLARARQLGHDGMIEILETLA